MSIASEIARLQQAKADLKAAIEAKGVTVPSDATFDDFPTLVEDISGGGGSGATELNFFPCSLSSGAKGAGSGPEPGGGGGMPTPETEVTFYASYPSVGATPIAVLIHDKYNAFFWGGYDSPHGGYALVYTGNRAVDSSFTGMYITVISLTNTLATLQWFYPMSGQSFDPSGYEIAPIYAISNE